jgi:hypothetical protein
LIGEPNQIGLVVAPADVTTRHKYAGVMAYKRSSMRLLDRPLFMGLALLNEYDRLFSVKTLISLLSKVREACENDKQLTEKDANIAALAHELVNYWRNRFGQKTIAFAGH